MVCRCGNSFLCTLFSLQVVRGWNISQPVAEDLKVCRSAPPGPSLEHCTSQHHQEHNGNIFSQHSYHCNEAVTVATSRGYRWQPGQVTHAVGYGDHSRQQPWLSGGLTLCSASAYEMRARKQHFDVSCLMTFLLIGRKRWKRLLLYFITFSYFSFAVHCSDRFNENIFAIRAFAFVNIFPGKTNISGNTNSNKSDIWYIVNNQSQSKLLLNRYHVMAYINKLAD